MNIEPFILKWAILPAFAAPFKFKLIIMCWKTHVILYYFIAAEENFIYHHPISNIERFVSRCGTSSKNLTNIKTEFLSIIYFVYFETIVDNNFETSIAERYRSLKLDAIGRVRAFLWLAVEMSMIPVLSHSLSRYGRRKQAVPFAYLPCVDELFARENREFH